MSLRSEEKKYLTPQGRLVLVWLPSILAIVVLLGALLWGVPQYRVYSQEMRGAAALAEATQNRQILIEQADAELESAEKFAQAIEIVGQAAKEYPEYRQQLFIQGFSEALQGGIVDQIIYVPTEAMIPITEAGHR